MKKEKKKREAQIELKMGKFLVLIRLILGQILKDCDLRIIFNLFHDGSLTINLSLHPIEVIIKGKTLSTSRFCGIF